MLNDEEAPGGSGTGDTGPGLLSRRSPRPYLLSSTDLSQSPLSGVPLLTSIYQSLDRTSTDIRLLEIAGSTPGSDDISCTVHTVSLQDRPVFVALSYVWGDPTLIEHITVNGIRTRVTASLAAALKWVKHHWQKRFPMRDISRFRLWVDALCIHQDDVDEKNHQVGLMSLIYKRAELVIASISYGDPEIRFAFKVYRNIHKLLIHNGSLVTDRDLKTREWMRKIPLLVEKDDAIELSTHNRAWNAIDSFASLPYWERMWIVQEIILAKDVLMICDNDSLDVLKVLEISDLLLKKEGTWRNPTFEFITELPKHRTWCDKCFDHLKYPQVLERKTRTRTEEVDPLTSPVLIMSPRKASEPRDHVYGLLGLTDAKIVVDYRKSVREVYQDYATATLMGAKDVTCGFFKNSLPGGPTWVPDYS